MTDSAASNTRYVLLGAVGDGATRDALRRDLEQLCDPTLEVQVCERGQELLALADTLSPPAARVPLVIVGQGAAGHDGRRVAQRPERPA